MDFHGCRINLEVYGEGRIESLKRPIPTSPQIRYSTHSISRALHWERLFLGGGCLVINTPHPKS